MLNGLILKVTKFQLPPPKRLGTVVKNILGGAPIGLYGDNKYTASDICKMIEFLVDNIYLRFGRQLFRQTVGIPMRTNCVPLLADFFLNFYGNESLDKLIKEGKRKLARKFNLSYRYIDDLISFNNKRFKEFISDIYSKELTISAITESTNLESRNKQQHYHQILWQTWCVWLAHCELSFYVNQYSASAYGVYVSQLIRYAHCCSNYNDILSCHRAFSDKTPVTGLQN